MGLLRFPRASCRHAVCHNLSDIGDTDLTTATLFTPLQAMISCNGHVSITSPVPSDIYNGKVKPFIYRAIFESKSVSLPVRVNPMEVDWVEPPSSDGDDPMEVDWG